MSRKYTSSWSSDEDLILVDIILRYTRTGKKIKDAYLEAEKTLTKRSAVACKNQWVTRLSKIYDSAFEQARLQQMICTTKNIEIDRANEGETMPTEIIFPKNRPINSVGAAMEKALEETKKQRSTTILTPIEDPSSKKEKSEENEKAVTTGIQQEIDFEKNIVTDAKEEKSLDNPFIRIRKFVHKMEKEYGDIIEESNGLRKDIQYLKEENENLKKKEKKSEEQEAGYKAEIVRLQDMISALEEKGKKLQKELDSYSEIKELIKQFHKINE